MDNVLNIVLKALGEEKLLAENKAYNINKTNVKTGQPRPIATEQKSREVQPERDSLNNNGIHSIKAEPNDAHKEAYTQGQVIIPKEKNKKKSRNRILLAVLAAQLIICILIGVAISSMKQKNTVTDDKKTLQHNRLLLQKKRVKQKPAKRVKKQRAQRRKKKVVRRQMQEKVQMVWKCRIKIVNRFTYIHGMLIWAQSLTMLGRSIRSTLILLNL